MSTPTTTTATIERSIVLAAIKEAFGPGIPIFADHSDISPTHTGDWLGEGLGRNVIEPNLPATTVTESELRLVMAHMDAIIQDIYRVKAAVAAIYEALPEPEPEPASVPSRLADIARQFPNIVIGRVSAA